MNEKLGQEQAFPMEQHDGNDLYEIHHGMSKRFYAACAAMQGLLSSNMIIETAKSGKISSNEIMTSIVSSSYQFADELLKQENL